MLNGKPSSNGHKAARAPSQERDATGDTALPIKRRKLDDADAETVRPNNDSINHAEEAEATLMQLEVKELLAEVAVHQHTIDAVQSFVERLASTLRELPSSIVDPSPIRGLLSDFKFPTDRSFAFQPPQQVRLIGSFAINAASHPSSIADVAIVMPRSCFDDKDYLNHRYHAKRALYLSHVAAVLQARADRLGIADINWDVLRGDARRPTVVFKLQGADQQGGPGWCEVRLVPALVVGAFPFQKMAPEKNCLRSVNKRKKESESKATEDPADSQLLPTPCYNATVIEDMLLVEHANLLAATAATAPCVSQAAVLLRVWGRQQCIFEGADGVSGFFLTMLMCHLVASGKVSSALGPMHLFRAVLVALGNPKTFANNTVTFMQRRPSSTSQVAVPSPPKAASWRTGGNSIVFLDSSGWLNLGASVSQAALQQARECASLTISMFSASSGPDAFDAAFLTSRSLPLLFDAWYHVIVPDNSDTFEVATGNPFAQDRPWWQSTDARVSQLAAKGLSDRATLVRVFYRAATLPDTAITKGNSKSPHSHRLRKPNAILPQRRFVTLAVRLNPTEALRSVDIGPPADSGPPAAAFRAFWGAKSELRRFQDGAIAEAVVWNRSLGQRHVIIDDLVRHVLTRHLPQGTVVETHCTILDAALYRRHGGAASLDEDLAISRRIEDASVRLGKRLRSLQGLVLKIVGTQPLAPSLRHAAVFPPQPHVLAGAPSSGKGSTSAVPRCLPAVEMLCQVEGSGKWPDDPDAFAKMKAAVGVQIAESLQSGFGMEAAAAEDYIDVYTDGFAFRLRLHTERDASMLEIQLARAGHTQPPPLDDVALKVWHHGAVSAAAAANPAFEPALRLAKRWVASQWLSPHLSEEAVELLMVAVFHGAGAGVASPPPASRLAGFLGFLRLLTDHPWAVQPLVPEAPVGVGGSTGCSRRNVAAKAHAARRAAAAAAQNTRGAAPAMFLTGPRDDECVGWTQERPSAPMLHRIVVLARKAAAVLETRLLSGFVAAPQTTEKPTTTSFHQTRHALSANRTDVGIDEGVDLMEEVFVHDDSDYEVIIRLRADAIPHGDLAIKPSIPHRSSKSTSSLKVRTKILPRDDDAPESAKLSRAVLKGIPRSVLKSRGSSAVRKELLVAFEPVSLFVDLLEQRFADVAVVCADYVGGDAVGLKLKGPMLRLGPVKAETGHAQKPSGAATTRGDTALIVCPDIEAMAADALSLGIGLAECAEIKAM